MIPSPLSLTTAVLVTSIDGTCELSVSVTVGSLSVLPSVSSPSSEISNTSLTSPGLLATAETVFDTPPVSKACWLMT